MSAQDLVIRAEPAITGSLLISGTWLCYAYAPGKAILYRANSYVDNVL